MFGWCYGGLVGGGGMCGVEGVFDVDGVGVCGLGVDVVVDW